MAITTLVRTLAATALLSLLFTPRLVGHDALSVAHAAVGNSGDIKISDSPLPAQGNQGNEPHVQCQFYVLGFNFAASSGIITVRSWPPTGDGTVVLERPYAMTSPSSSGDYQFVNGPYTLPAGHYKVYVTDNKGGSIAKQKVFWIDGCAATSTPTPVPSATATDSPTAVPTATATDSPTAVPTATDSPTPTPAIPTIPSSGF